MTWKRFPHDPLCWDNDPSSGFPSQMDSIVELWCFVWYQPEQLQSLVISDAMAPMWRNSNGIGSLKIAVFYAWLRTSQRPTHTHTHHTPTTYLLCLRLIPIENVTFCDFSKLTNFYFTDTNYHTLSWSHTLNRDICNFKTESSWTFRFIY